MPYVEASNMRTPPNSPQISKEPKRRAQLKRTNSAIALIALEIFPFPALFLCPPASYADQLIPAPAAVARPRIGCDRADHRKPQDFCARTPRLREYPSPGAPLPLGACGSFDRNIFLFSRPSLSLRNAFNRIPKRFARPAVGQCAMRRSAPPLFDQFLYARVDWQSFEHTDVGTAGVAGRDNSDRRSYCAQDKTEDLTPHFRQRTALQAKL